MGEGLTKVVLVFCGLCAFGFGIYYLVSGALAYSHDDPEEKKGTLKPFEQTYVCPGNRSRGQVFYQGDACVFATLTNGLTDVSKSYNKTTFEGSKSISAKSNIVTPFTLVQGSIVKWSVTSTGIKAPDFYFYQKRIPFCSGVYCVPSKSSSNLFIFSDSETVGSDDIYYAEINNGGEYPISVDYTFEVLHTRYLTESDRIDVGHEHAIFSLPKDDGQVIGCVFVENVIKESGSMKYLLSYKLTEEAKQSRLIVAMVISALLIVVGIVVIVLSVVCV